MDTPPQILHVDSADEWRGGQSLLLRLVRGMHARGARVGVACPPTSRLWSELEFLGDARVPIPAGWSPRTTWRLRQASPDLLVAHTSHAHGCCAPLSTPLVVHRWVDFPPSGGWKYQRPDGWVACSRAVAELVSAAGGRNVSVVYGGIDVPDPTEPAADAPDVLAVGARVHHKGHEFLAAAARRMPEIDVAIAGDGALVFPGPRWLGHREDVPALLAGCRVFVQPSRTEGLGMSVVEAMMARVPVVASRAGGIPEVVGEHGTLVEVGDVPGLVAAIQRVLTGEHPCVDAARAFVMERFTTDAMVEGAIGAYARVLTQGQG